jgi:hypothetical protein
MNLQKETIQIWLYENTAMKMEGVIIVSCRTRPSSPLYAYMHALPRPYMLMHALYANAPYLRTTYQHHIGFRRVHERGAGRCGGGEHEDQGEENCR